MGIRKCLGTGGLAPFMMGQRTALNISEHERERFFLKVEQLSIGFNYTFTKSYAGMDCDKPEKDKWGYTSCLDSGHGWLEKGPR